MSLPHQIDEGDNNNSDDRDTKPLRHSPKNKSPKNNNDSYSSDEELQKVSSFTKTKSKSSSSGSFRKSGSMRRKSSTVMAIPMHRSSSFSSGGGKKTGSGSGTFSGDNNNNEDEDGMVLATVKSSSDFRSKNSAEFGGFGSALYKKSSGDFHDDDENEVGEDGLPKTGGKKSLKDTYNEMTENEFSLAHRFFNIIHGDPVLSPDDIIGSTYHTILIIAILMSIGTLIVSSDPAFYDPSDSDPTFNTLEYVSVAIFSVDIIFQCAAAEQWEHVIHFQFFIDFLSVFGFYLGLMLKAGGITADTAVFLILRIFRLTRILRVLKVGAAASAMELIMNTLLNSKQGLLMLISLISVVTLLGGAVLYYLEVQFSEFDVASQQWYRNDGEVSPFQSVPATFWFVIVTITTIGYGDVVPYSVPGKIATMILMLFGVLLLSFPNILIGAQFQVLHRSFQREKARKHLGMIFRRSRMLIRFVRLWREYTVRGGLELILDVDPFQQLPDEEEDEGDLDLFGNDDEEEEEEEDGGDDESGEDGGAMQRTFESNAKKHEVAVEDLLHVPEHMKKRHRHYVNFWFYPGEFPAIDFDISEKVLTEGNFDRFWVGGSESGGSRISALMMTQRLIESFSGCATLDELFESFALYPPYPGATVRRSDVQLMMLHLGKSRHVFIFILSRTEENYVCAFTKTGLNMMRTFPETALASCPCFRSLGQASSVWKRTTRKTLPLDSPFGFDGYPKWQVAQALVPRYDVTTFTENLRLTSSRRNHVVFLKSGFQANFANVTMPPLFGSSAATIRHNTNSATGFIDGSGSANYQNVASASSPKGGSPHPNKNSSSSSNKKDNKFNSEKSNSNTNNAASDETLNAASSTASASTTSRAGFLEMPSIAITSSGGAGSRGQSPSTTPKMPHLPDTSSSSNNNNNNAPSPLHLDPSSSSNKLNDNAGSSLQVNGSYGSNYAAAATAAAASSSIIGAALSSPNHQQNMAPQSPHNMKIAFYGTSSPSGGQDGSGNANYCYCPHCVHCMTQEAVLPQLNVDSMWKSKKEKAMSDFVWKTDESVLELQVEYLQNWLQLIRHVKKNPQLVKKIKDISQ